LGLPGKGSFGVEVASGGAIRADLRHAHDDLGSLLDGLGAYLTPSIQRMLDRLAGTPVAVSDATWTLLLANPMYTALMGELHGNERNAVWRNFPGSGSRVRYTPQSRRALEAAQVAERLALLAVLGTQSLAE
jgi:MmyB-like transcription regulator ligand binding domain